MICPTEICGGIVPFKNNKHPRAASDLICYFCSHLVLHSASSGSSVQLIPLPAGIIVWLGFILGMCFVLGFFGGHDGLGFVCLFFCVCVCVMCLGLWVCFRFLFVCLLCFGVCYFVSGFFFSIALLLWWFILWFIMFHSYFLFRKKPNTV